VPRLEIEIKLKVSDERGMRERLEKAGARLLHGRELEDNRVFDFPDQALQRRGEMLRIRILERGVVLTFKGPGSVEDGKKVREETESNLDRSEAGALTDILQGIGMRQAFRYQKYRTTWTLEGLHVTLDETPIGSFLELEGNSESIDSVATLLGYTPVEYIASSYRDLYMMKQIDTPGSGHEMIFQG
jgi:adenylate cyclase class 2